MDAHIRPLIREMLPRVADDLEGLLANSIRLRTQSANESDLPVGVSKIGGNPDLPPDTKWPTRGDALSPKPLSFIAQLRLPDVTEYDPEGVLPRSGMLYFFYDADDQPWGSDPADRDSWRVVHATEHPDTLVRTPPFGLGESAIFKPCAVAFATEISLPGWDSATIDSLDLTEEEDELYNELVERIIELKGIDNGPLHRLLGYPDQIQNDMQLECQLSSHGLRANDPGAGELREGAADWVLLLQIDSDESAEMQWGDRGSIYFMIRRQDLQAHDFDNVWLILQCY